MKKTDAQIHISINFECPHCDYYINLFDYENLIDAGYIYDKSLSSYGWGCKDFNEEIQCPECNEEFIIQDIIY